MSDTPTDFYAEYKRLIDVLDTTVLSPIKKNMDSAPTEHEKKKWEKQMSDSLDERLRLMTLRDSFKKDLS